MTNYLFALVVGLWVSLHVSQSLMDLMDFLLVITALWVAFKGRDLKNWARSFKPYQLWPAWILVICLGFLFGAPVEMKVALKNIWEFRWILSFISYIYLFKRISWNESQIRVLTFVLFLITLIDVVLFFVNYSQDPRAGGMIGHSMPFAHTMGPSALFLIFVGGKKALDGSLKKAERFVYALAPLLASTLVILSFTRGIWIGFVAALLFCAAFLGRKVFLSTILALAVSGGVMFATSSRIQSRVLGKTVAETQSNDERRLYWSANFKIFKDYPFFGIGYSQNNIHVEDYLKRDGVNWLSGAHAHNQYIHFLAGTGGLGLAAFLTFLVVVFLRIGRNLLSMRRKHDQSDHFYLLLGIFAGLLCFVIGALTESNFSIAKNRFLFLFIAAIGYALSTRQSKMTSKE